VARNIAGDIGCTVRRWMGDSTYMVGDVQGGGAGG